MTSIQELKVVRAFRALNTMIQLCHDRGYVIRHPSAIAEAVADPSLYDPKEGLDYDWFLRHFVVTPERAAALRTGKKGSAASAAAAGGGGGDQNEGEDGTGKKKKRSSSSGGGAAKERLRNEEEDEDDAAGEAEVLRRATNGEWICMRNAMRLTCSVDPARAKAAALKTSPAAAAAARSSAVAPVKPDEPSVVKKEQDDDDAVLGSEQAAAAAAAAATRAAAKAAKNALMVFFSGEPKLTMKEVQACREKALKKKAATMIIVTNKVEPGVRLDVQELSGRMDQVTSEALLSIQVFEEEALAFNVVRHDTVPHHEALSEAEAEAFLAAHKLNISQLPRMLESDPLVQYLGLQRGSIVHITREGKQGGPYSMYRHVI